MKKLILAALILLSQTTFLVSQTCVVCDQTPSGLNASIIGNASTADGLGSIAIGSNAHTLSNATSSVAIGTMVQTIAGKSIVIGCGSGPSAFLSNNVQESLMIGFNSSKPTLFVSRSDFEKTGRIGIGNITSPLAKLHIRSDDGEDAALLIEPNNWESGETAALQLGNANNNITSKNTNGMTFNSENNFLFTGGFSGFGVIEPKTKIHVNGDILFEESFNGLIMKSQDGNCWKGNLSNSGELIFTQVDCETLSSNNNISDPKHSDVFIYPNPSNGHITIDYTGKEKNLIVEICSINGLLLSTCKIKRDENRIDISSIRKQIVILTTFTTKGDLISTNKILISK